SRYQDMAELHALADRLLRQDVREAIGISAETASQLESILRYQLVNPYFQATDLMDAVGNFDYDKFYFPVLLGLYIDQRLQAAQDISHLTIFPVGHRIKADVDDIAEGFAQAVQQSSARGKRPLAVIEHSGVPESFIRLQAQQLGMPYGDFLFQPQGLAILRLIFERNEKGGVSLREMLSVIEEGRTPEAGRENEFLHALHRLLAKYKIQTIPEEPKFETWLKSRQAMFFYERAREYLSRNDVPAYFKDMREYARLQREALIERDRNLNTVIAPFIADKRDVIMVRGEGHFFGEFEGNDRKMDLRDDANRQEMMAQRIIIAGVGKLDDEDLLLLQQFVADVVATQLIEVMGQKTKTVRELSAKVASRWTEDEIRELIRRRAADIHDGTAYLNMLLNRKVFADERPYFAIPGYKGTIFVYEESAERLASEALDAKADEIMRGIPRDDEEQNASVKTSVSRVRPRLGLQAMRSALAEDQDVLNLPLTDALRRILGQARDRLSPERHDEIVDEIHRLYGRADPDGTGQIYETMTLKEFIELKRALLFAKGTHRIGFRNRVFGERQFFLGASDYETLLYDTDFLECLERLDLQNRLKGNHTNLTAEYIFHEAMEHSGLGHQSARLLQSVLFPENYMEGEELLKSAIRVFTQRDRETTASGYPNQLMHFVYRYANYLRDGLSLGEMPREFIDEVTRFGGLLKEPLAKQTTLSLPVVSNNSMPFTMGQKAPRSNLQLLWDDEIGLLVLASLNNGEFAVFEMSNAKNYQENPTTRVSLTAAKIGTGTDPYNLIMRYKLGKMIEENARYLQRQEQTGAAIPEEYIQKVKRFAPIVDNFGGLFSLTPIMRNTIIVRDIPETNGKTKLSLYWDDDLGLFMWFKAQGKPGLAVNPNTYQKFVEPEQLAPGTQKQFEATPLGTAQSLAEAI
ncbi:MAG: hypothetical protein Q8Q33_00675, partial [Chlamydiota bacterium]|nr:hypothetical protein [Chlamydiota bacterium]